ncbi:MetS family NSS transporter small subunit [Methanocaldococcus sp.]|nr:MetS family NSS transporter small subunit [Methanocaldococcus sp.]MCQ6253482.1 MetS family NSS transporter small subunit [Methanocaldococcus sp.]
MPISAIVMFIFGATVLWGGSIYFLWKSIKQNEEL